MKLVTMALLLVCATAFAEENSEAPERYIPLDADDPSIDSWKEVRDLAADQREPGLIQPQRFSGGPAYTGIPTFFNLPIAITPEDLRAAEVDVAILGAPLDTGSGMRGAAWGPRRFRTANNNLFWGTDATPHLHTMINWQQELTVVDYGDAPIDNLSGERSMAPVRRMVRQIAATGAIPIIIGGDHSLEYPNVAGVADVHGKANVGVVHFDAHFDAGIYGSGHLITHGKPIRRLIEEGHVLGRNYIQVGLRGYWPGEEGFEWMRKQGMRYHTMAEVERDGWAKVMERVLAEAREGTEFLYISLDIDVLDPAYAPGTGTPEPGGLTSRELFPLIRGLCSDNKLVGFDLVEFNPLVDPGYTTGLNADRAVRECLTGIAMNRKGLKSGYLSPLTEEDDR